MNEGMLATAFAETIPSQVLVIARTLGDWRLPNHPRGSSLKDGDIILAQLVSYGPDITQSKLTLHETCTWFAPSVLPQN